MQGLLDWFVANVWPNLVASGICFACSTALTLWKLRQHHRQHMAKLDAIHRSVEAQQ